jgi:hypothetical protein
MWSFVKRFGWIALLAFLILFGYENIEPLSQTAQFHFNFHVSDLIFETPELPLVFLLVGAFLLGMIAAGLQGLYEKMARRMDIRRRDKRIRELERELEELRAQPPAVSGSAPALPGTSTLPAATARGAPLEENPTL